MPEQPVTDMNWVNKMQGRGKWTKFKGKPKQTKQHKETATKMNGISMQYVKKINTNAKKP